MKTYIVYKQNNNFVIISVNMLFSETQGTVRDLSRMRVSYNLTNRTTKTEKIEKHLKKLKNYNVINFKPIRYRLLRVKLFFQSSVAILWDRSEFYGYIEKKDRGKKANKKKLSEKSGEAINNMNKHSSGNCMFDPMNLFSKPMRTSISR